MEAKSDGGVRIYGGYENSGLWVNERMKIEYLHNYIDN